MSVLISSSPPLPSIFLDLYQDCQSLATHAQDHREVTRVTPRLQKIVPPKLPSFRPQLSFVRRKKSVVFADKVGLPLTQVKVLQAEEHLEAGPRHLAATPPPLTFHPGLRLNFPQPLSKSGLLKLVKQNHVSLETAMADKFTISGSVLVHNLSFEKSVCVRYTRDYWISHVEVAATYSRSISPQIDQFRFRLELSEKLPPGLRLEFCVSANIQGEVFWDSNNTNNYQVECVMLPNKARLLSVLAGEEENSIREKLRATLIRDTDRCIYY